MENGTFVYHYRIISSLGKGGMGEVYRAHDPRLDREVAIKILPSEFANDPERVRRFEQEAQAASALSHPNIISIFDIGSCSAGNFIVMELVAGQTLRSIIDQGRSKELVSDVGSQVAKALSAAHSARITHRDIKPDNIMLREDGYVKVLDFGLARLTHTASSGEDAATLAQQTLPGTVLGTVAYMAPEQIRGEAAGPATDVFALGILLYEMASGQHPFKSESLIGYMHAITGLEPKPLSSLVPDIQPAVNDLILRMLSKEKDHRPSASEVARVFQSIDRGGALATTSQEAVSSSSRSASPSIVVLPFTNTTADPENEYFCDGLTEELISDLSRIRSMRVISRNSAMRLKGASKDLKTIATELNVRYILDGSVRKAGNNLRISAQLIDGQTDANLWAEKFTGSLDDIFDIQESVSRSIAEALKITLTAGEIEQLEARPISDARAYDLYLRARAEFLRGDPESLSRSADLLRQGLEIIGENELLNAGVGYAHYYYFRWISKLDIGHLDSAEKYLQKTFALNPGSSHGYTLKGLLSYSRGNMAEAIAALRLAIESDPSNTEALLWLIVNLNYIGAGAESKPYADRLLSIDPLTPINIFIIAFVHIYRGEFTEGRPYLQRALEIDAKSPLLIWSALVAEAWCEDVPKTCYFADQLVELAPGWVYTEHGLFLKHAMLGEKEAALKHYVPDFDKEAAYDCHFALHLAHCFALIGEKSKALDLLEMAVRGGMFHHQFLSSIDPLLKSLRDEPRFKDLIELAKESLKKVR